MKHCLIVLYCVAAIFTWGGGSAAAAATPTASVPATRPAKPPNIIFILTDDLGWGDLGVFFQNARRAGGPATPAHRTPNLDAMARDGIRFTDQYCPAPVCAPSRASLLLGVSQGHANVRNNQFDKALEDNHTVATVLRRAGYATAAIGKWGLQGTGGKGAGDEEAAGADAARPDAAPGAAAPAWPAHPLNRGFDSYYGYMRHADGHEHYPKEGPYRNPKQVWEDRAEVSAGLDKCYTADLFTARAKRWIVDQTRKAPAQPFFLYLAYDTPHAVCELPTQAYPAGGGLKGGLQWLGQPGHMINTASGKVDSWTHPDYATATWDADGNPATPAAPWPDVSKRYATSVRRIDDCVGDLSALLKDLSIDDDTLVVFTSDNGISLESYLKGQPLDPTFFASYGPFDGVKRDCWEGGTRVPTVARWPGHVAAGGVSKLPSTLADWLATFADAAGVPVPARCDSTSLMPTLTGRGGQREPLVYIEYFMAGKTPDFKAFEPAHRGRFRRQMQALRFGDYVCVRYDIKGADDDFEIYDVAADPKEAHNLAGQTDVAALQAKAKRRVAEVRRPDPDAKRPYDDEPMAAAADDGGPNLKPGVRWDAYAGSFPWAPQFDGLTPAGSGRADRPGLPVGGGDKPAGAWRVSASIDVPADGAYTVKLTTDGTAVLRVHDAVVVDADFGHKPGVPAEGTVRLKAGRHPFLLSCARVGPEPKELRLDWTGPGGDNRPADVRYVAE